MRRMTLALLLIIGATGPGSTEPQTAVPTAARTIPISEGVVRGQVADGRSTRPVPGATVEFVGRNHTTTAMTDSDGRYEVSGLEPGEYRVHARAQGYVPTQYGQRSTTDRGSTLDVQGGRFTTGVDLWLQPVGAVSGRVLGNDGEGLAGVEIELISDRYLPGGPAPVAVAFAQTDGLGAFRISDVLPADYYVRAYSQATPRPSREGTAQAYAATFFPSVAHVDHAQRLRVAAGQELFGVEFPLVTTPTRRVEGTIMDPAGGPLRPARVRMTGVGLNSIRAEYDAYVDANGWFEIRGVVPGDYMIHVLDPTPGSRWLSAGRQIRVEDDLVGLEFRAQVGARVDGRIVRDPGATRSLNPSGMSVSFEWRIGPNGWLGSRSDVHTSGGFGVEADGIFSIQSPGAASSIRITDIPTHWTIKSIRLDDVDITDQEVDFGEGASRRLEVVLTDRVSSVFGNVVDRTGRSVAHRSVVVFPDDRARWSTPSRFIRETRSGPEGRFQFEALPPADYLVVAVEGLPSNAWMDPEVLGRLRPSATPFRLGEGEQRTLSLRVSPAPDGLIPAH